MSARYRIVDVSVGEAGLTARPAVFDTVEQRTIQVYRKSDRAAAERHVATLNDDPKENTMTSYDPNALPGTPGNPSTGGTRTVVATVCRVNPALVHDGLCDCPPAATYVYRYHFGDYTGHVEVAIYDPTRWAKDRPENPGGARFGYDAEVFISERGFGDAAVKTAEVSQGSIGGTSPEDASLRIDVYTRAMHIAGRANAILQAGGVVNAETLALPPMGVEVDGLGQPVIR